MLYFLSIFPPKAAHLRSGRSNVQFEYPEC